MSVNVSYVQAGGYSAAQQRMANAALLTKAGAANKVRAGILPFNGAELLPGPSTPTPDMHTVITPGCVVILDAAGGAYVCVSDSTVTVLHDPASTTNPRTDLIIFRVYDNEAGDATGTSALTLPGTAGSVNVETITGAIEIVKGNAAVGAPVPALPNVPAGARCVVLDQVTIPQNAASIVAANHNTSAAIGRPGRTVAAGGVLPVLTEAEIAGLTQHEGQLFDAADTDRVLRSNGATASVLADPSVFTAWTAYTPVWNGTIGNGTIVGSFKQVGKTVYWRMRMVLGSTSSGPGTVYTWTVPVAAVVPFGSHTPAGDANFWGGAKVDGSAVLIDATHVQAWFTGQAAAAQSGNPGTWAAGAEIVLWGTYEGA